MISADSVNQEIEADISHSFLIGNNDHKLLSGIIDIVQEHIKINNYGNEQHVINDEIRAEKI